MKKLKLRNLRYRQPSQGGNGACIKVDCETYNFINQLKEETGYSTPKLMRKIINYVDKNIEWVESEEEEMEGEE